MSGEWSQTKWYTVEEIYAQQGLEIPPNRKTLHTQLQRWGFTNIGTSKNPVYIWHPKFAERYLHYRKSLVAEWRAKNPRRAWEIDKARRTGVALPVIRATVQAWLDQGNIADFTTIIPKLTRIDPTRGWEEGNLALCLRTKSSRRLPRRRLTQPWGQRRTLRGSRIL